MKKVFLSHSHKEIYIYLTKNKMPEKITWRFQKYANFWFIIPDNRESYGWDFFVNKANWKDAEDWDLVVWHILAKTKWKKPEATVIQIWREKEPKPKFLTGVYSEHKWDFWFVDVEEHDKWYFVFKKDIAWANDWDKVEAIIKIHKWKKQAVIQKVIENDTPLIIWKYKDEWKFWFVIPDKWSHDTDIFVAWAKKLEGKTWDKVWVQIIKHTWRRPEGVIRKIL